MKDYTKLMATISDTVKSVFTEKIKNTFGEKLFIDFSLQRAMDKAYIKWVSKQ